MYPRPNSRNFWIAAALLWTAAGSAFAEERERFVLEGLLARVGEETVLLSDVQRFRAIESIMQCIGSRTKVPGQDTESAKRTLGRYIDEELIFAEARSKLSDMAAHFQEAIRKIKGTPACLGRWRTLGERYSQLYNTKASNLAGEGMVVRELEKRIIVDAYAREKIGMDMKTWLQEARVKVPIKFYTE